MPQERLIHYSTTTAQYYEDKSILTSYDRFHFGPGLLGVKNFPQRMAEVAVTRQRILIYPARALRALGLLLADGAPTVGGGKTF